MSIKLNEIAYISAGQSAPQGNSFSDSGTPFIRAGSLEPLLLGKPEEELELVNSKVAKKYRLKLQPAGTIVFAKSGMSCMKGYVYVLKRPCYVVSHLACILPIRVNSSYLAYYFEWYKPNRLVKDESYPSISLADISQIPIKVHSNDEQIGIVTSLDGVSNLISLQKKQLSLMDVIIKSRFVEMFGDNNYPMEKLDNNVVEMFIGPFGSSLKNECFVNKSKGFCMVYEQKHAIQKTMDVPTRYVPESKYEELKRFTVLGGDIIVSCRGTIGEIYIIPDDAPMGIMHPSIMKIRLNTEKYNPQYFVFALEQYMKEYSEKAYGTGVKMAVSATVLGQTDFLVPPMDIQDQFSDFVSQTDKSKFAIQKSLEELETLKKALMQQYFG